MFKNYLQLKKARKLMKKVNKLSFWKAELIENEYDRKLVISNSYMSSTSEDLTNILSLLIDEEVSFYFRYDPEELIIKVNFK